MNDRDFATFRNLASELCGICFDESKKYVLESRLDALLRSENYSNYQSLAGELAKNRELKVKFVDAITNNETLFFRDQSPFDALKYKVVPEIIDAKENTLHPQRLRIWSAACSTGQEAYSIAMSLAELLPNLSEWDIQILGTDISEAALATARSGCYSDLEVSRGLPDNLRNLYFKRTPAGWEILPGIGRMCSFEKRNLNDPLRGLGPFDVIFCRNVAIYFSGEQRASLFRRLSNCLTPEGFLFSGAAECLSDLGPSFKPLTHCRARFYRPNLNCAKARV